MSERWNARYVAQEGLRFVVRSHAEAPAAVQRIATEEPLRTRLCFALRSLGENRGIDQALDAVAAELRA